MTCVLRAMQATAQQPQRREVLIPAYTCYSVAASIVRAGLRPRLYDIDPETLDFDPASIQRVAPNNVLAIISANLYGIPNSLDRLEALARDNGLYLIDDAAQALGARFKGRPLGGYGDVGILSFEKGKNITTLKGGAIVGGSGPLMERIERARDTLPGSPLVGTLMSWAKLPAYALFFRPELYGLVQSLPWLELGITRYEEDFAIEQYSPSLAGLALRLCDRLDQLNRQRNANAERVSNALRPFPEVRLLRRLEGSQEALVRLPVFVESAALRTRLIAELNAAGIGASGSYPQALCDVPEVRRLLPAEDLEMPKARRVAATVVTLPTHPYCPPDLADRIGSVLRRVTQSVAP